jgi:predicted extracellular nuclease
MKRSLLLAVILPLLFSGLKAQVVINEVYGGGGNSGAVFTNDFVELYNNSASAVTMTSWSVQYTSSNGTAWGSNKTTFSGVIQPNGYFLI